MPPSALPVAPTVHVAAGQSIAETLRTVLALLGRPERVIGLPTCLSIGPIDPPDPALRDAWCRTALRADPASPYSIDGAPAEAAAAWDEATAPGVDPVFWLHRTDPMEHACFLAFAARMDGRPFDLVDATGFGDPAADGAWSMCSLGMIRPREIVAARLIETRRPLAAAERQGAASAWAGLRSENAPFRVVRGGRLVSAPMEHYDDLVAGQASPEWEVAARVVGRVMAALFTAARTARADGDTAGDLVLFGRMLALVESGRLAIRGPGPEMRDYEVRRSGGGPAGGGAAARTSVP